MKNPEDFCLNHSAFSLWILRYAQNGTLYFGKDRASDPTSFNGPRSLGTAAVDSCRRRCMIEEYRSFNRPVERFLQMPKWRNWQTRMVQVHVLARVWGFESLLRHQI